jgi:hypothetical protein
MPPFPGQYNPINPSSIREARAATFAASWRPKGSLLVPMIANNLKAEHPELPAALNLSKVMPVLD